MVLTGAAWKRHSKGSLRCIHLVRFPNSGEERAWLWLPHGQEPQICPPTFVEMYEKWIWIHLLQVAFQANFVATFTLPYHFQLGPIWQPSSSGILLRWRVVRHYHPLSRGMKFLPWVDLRDDHIMIYGWWPLSIFPMSLQSRSCWETSPIHNHSEAPGVWATHLRNEALDNSFRFDWFVHQDSEDLHLWSVHLRNKSRRSGRLQGWWEPLIFLQLWIFVCDYLCMYVFFCCFRQFHFFPRLHQIHQWCFTPKPSFGRFRVLPDFRQ